MNIDIKDIGKGWFEIGIGLTSSDVDLLIERLKGLQSTGAEFDHFHFRSEFAVRAASQT